MAGGFYCKIRLKLVYHERSYIMSRANRFYLFITIFLAVAAITGGVTLGLRHSRNQPVEIVLSQVELPELSGELYISGAVASPGIYALREGDTLQAVLSAAGLEQYADLDRIEIYVPGKSQEQSPQKIDINRAEPWLLEALPSIGAVTAQNIVDYRSGHGPFKTIEGLLEVSGIGPATFEKIKDYITVSD
jgi:competence protein ComEA